MIFMKLTHLGFFFVSDKYVSNSVSISPRYCIWFFEKQPRGNFQEPFEGNWTLKINKYTSTAIINLWTNKFKHMIRSAGYELCQSWRFLYATFKTIVWWLYVHEKSIKISGQDGIAWREEKWDVKHYCHCLFEGKIYTKCNFSACSIQYCTLYSTAVDLIEFSRSDISQCSNQLFLILHPVRLRGIQYITRFDSVVSNISWSQTPRFLTHHKVRLRSI